MSFIEKKSAREFEAGDVIFREKDEGSSMFILQSGEVEVSAIKDKKKVVFAHLGKGAIFGEMALIDGHPRSATVTALRRTQCVEISRMLFQKNLEALPSWMGSFFGIMAERLREANKRAESLSTKDHSRQVVLMVSAILSGKESNAVGEIQLPWRPLVNEISVMLNLAYDKVDQVLNKMTLTEMARSEMSGEHGRVFIMKDFSQFKYFAEFCRSRFLEKQGEDVPDHFQKGSPQEKSLLDVLHGLMREQRWEPEIEQHLLEERIEQDTGGDIGSFKTEFKSLQKRGIISSKLDGDDVKIYYIDKDKLRTMLSMEETLSQFEAMDQKL